MNALKRKWATGEAALGAWLAMPSTVSAEIMARLGFDWLTIDLQHGLIGDRVRLSRISHTCLERLVGVLPHRLADGIYQLAMET